MVVAAGKGGAVGGGARSALGKLQQVRRGQDVGGLGCVWLPQLQPLQVGA